MKRSITWRITMVLTCLISLAVCLATVLTYFIYLHIEKKMINDLIETESARLVARVSRFENSWTKPFERDMGPSMFVWGESPQYPSSSLPAELRHLPIGIHNIDRGASTWYVVITHAMDGKLYVLYDSIVIEQQLRDFSQALVGIVIGCSIIAMLISHAVARWLITPLNLLTERLTRWVPNSSPAMVLHANEADRLMEVFNRVQDQVDASIADQREFSANLHHEIRTPLTIIRSDAELMLRSDLRDIPGSRSRLERIIRSVQEISQSLESTYSLAYAKFEEKTAVNMQACIGDIFDNLRLEAEKANLLFVNSVQPLHEEMISYHALMIVARNIVRNAVLHAAPASLIVESIPDGLQFTDSGPGIEASEISSIFDRYFSNRRADLAQFDNEKQNQPKDIQKSGIGLAIAKRVCATQGWGLDVISPIREGHGTRFILIFNSER